MKKFSKVLLGTCMVLSLLLISCGRDDINVRVEAVAGTADQGLDLEALGVLAGQSKDAEEFEKKLNQKVGCQILPGEIAIMLKICRLQVFCRNGKLF